MFPNLWKNFFFVGSVISNIKKNRVGLCQENHEPSDDDSDGGGDSGNKDGGDVVDDWDHADWRQQR